MSLLARRALRVARGFHTSASAASEALSFASHGHISDVLKLEVQEVASVGPSEVRVRMLAAPIHGADFDAITGISGAAGSLPAVGGIEGAGVVEEVGSAVQSLNKDDVVVPGVPSLGTWRTHLVAAEDDLLRVPPSVAAEAAATLGVGPCTALRILSDFATLKEGDVVVQNNADSAVGQAVIQIAKKMGVKTVNMVSNPSNYEEVSDGLKALGADVVTDYDYPSTHAFARLLSDLPAPSLGINGDGGATATAMARVLAPGSSLVTYGGSRLAGAVSVPASVFTQRGVSLAGFNLGAWMDTADKAQRQAMIDDVAAMGVKLWTKEAAFSDFQGAMAEAEASGDRTVVMNF